MVNNLESFEDAALYALVITVDDYSGLRAQGYNGFSDIEETNDDRKVHDVNLQYLGFEAEATIKLHNPTRDQVHKAVTDLRNIFQQNAAAGTQCLLYAYYGGAGASIGAPGQVIVLNGDDKHVGYPLETRLQTISSMNNLTSCIMVFDCSRVPLSPGLTMGANIEAEKEEWQKFEGELTTVKRNYIAFRSAGPSMQMSLASPVAQGFFQHIKDKCLAKGACGTADLMEFSKYTEVSSSMGVNVCFSYE